jgi:hypothetical protein
MPFLLFMSFLRKQESKLHYLACGFTAGLGHTLFFIHLPKWHNKLTIGNLKKYR